jgi:hypothetical protein
MTREDEDHVEARSNQTADDAMSSKIEREASAKAVLDNMARLRALRLAREAAEPARPAKTPRATSKKAAAKPKKSTAKAPALAAWLADQQNGGHRT